MSSRSHDAVIAVFEKHPYWGPELQRQFLHSAIAIRECRAVGDLFPAINSSDTALLVIDLDASLVECLTWLGIDVQKNPIQIPIIALGSPATAELEWIVREAGVTAFLPEFPSANSLARLCRRQLNHLD